MYAHAHVQRKEERERERETKATEKKKLLINIKKTYTNYTKNDRVYVCVVVCVVRIEMLIILFHVEETEQKKIRCEYAPDEIKSLTKCTSIHI